MNDEQLKKLREALAVVAEATKGATEVAVDSSVPDTVKTPAAPTEQDKLVTQLLSTAQKALEDSASGKGPKVLPGGEGGTSSKVDPEPFRRRPIIQSSRMPTDPNDRIAYEEAIPAHMRDYYNKSEADRNKLDADAKSAGMTTEAYLGLGGLDQYRVRNGMPTMGAEKQAQSDDVAARAKAVTGLDYNMNAPQGRAAARAALRQGSEINPYADVSEANATTKAEQTRLQSQIASEDATAARGREAKASGMVYDAVGPEAISGALAEKRGEGLRQALSETKFQASDAKNPRELRQQLIEENQRKKDEAYATGQTPVLMSETEISDAAYQRWKDLTTKGTVEDRRAYWTAQAQKMKTDNYVSPAERASYAAQQERAAIAQTLALSDWNQGNDSTLGALSSANVVLSSRGYSAANEDARSKARPALVAALNAQPDPNLPLAARNYVDREKTRLGNEYVKFMRDSDAYSGRPVGNYSPITPEMAAAEQRQLNAVAEKKKRENAASARRGS